MPLLHVSLSQIRRGNEEKKTHLQPQVSWNDTCENQETSHRVCSVSLKTSDRETRLLLLQKGKMGAICWIFNSIQALQKSLWVQSFSVELTTENSPHHHPFISVLLVFNVLSCVMWLPVDITNEDMSHRGPICEGGMAMWKSYCWTGKYWMEQKMHVLGRCY